MKGSHTAHHLTRKKSLRGDLSQLLSESILNDDTQKDNSHPNWSQLRIPSAILTNRSYHTASYYLGKVYVFGGYELNTGIKDDFVEFDYLDTTLGQPAKVQVKNPSQAPGALCRHSADVQEGKMYIFGGKKSSIGSSNALFAFDFMQQTWQKLNPTSDKEIPSLQSHSSCIDHDNKKIYYFGGFQNKRGYTNRVYEYDITKNQWRELISPSELKPEERSSHAATFLKGSMYIFGGQNNSQRCGDFWKFDCTSLIWTEIKTENCPRARSGHSAGTYQGHIIIFGGILGITHEVNDIYAFSISSQTWACLEEDSKNQKAKEKLLSSVEQDKPKEDSSPKSFFQKEHNNNEDNIKQESFLNGLKEENNQNQHINSKKQKDTIPNSLDIEQSQDINLSQNQILFPLQQDDDKIQHQELSQINHTSLIRLSNKQRQNSSNSQQQSEQLKPSQRIMRKMQLWQAAKLQNQIERTQTSYQTQIHPKRKPYQPQNKRKSTEGESDNSFMNNVYFQTKRKNSIKDSEQQKLYYQQSSQNLQGERLPNQNISQDWLLNSLDFKPTHVVSGSSPPKLIEKNCEEGISQLISFSKGKQLSRNMSSQEMLDRQKNSNSILRSISNSSQNNKKREINGKMYYDSMLRRKKLFASNNTNISNISNPTNLVNSEESINRLLDKIARVSMNPSIPKEEKEQIVINLKKVILLREFSDSNLVPKKIPSKIRSTTAITQESLTILEKDQNDQSIGRFPYLKSPTTETMRKAIRITDQKKKLEPFSVISENSQIIASIRCVKVKNGRIKNIKPQPRDGHSGIVIDNALLIIGGDRHKLSFNDMFEFDLAKALNSKQVSDTN